jgi:hypothetical protein
VSVVDAFLDWHVERALAVLENSSAPSTIQMTSGGLEMPDSLRGAPAELQQAWRLYETIVQAGRKTRESRSSDNRIAFQSNQPEFQRTVAGFLRGRVSAAEAVHELSRYEWGGWCGTGSRLLYVPQSKALLIAYLQLGRVDLALEASEGLEEGFAEEDKTTPWDRRLLAAAGIDWERFYLGGALSGQTDLANTLARQGSERAARQLVVAARVLDRAAERQQEPTSERLLWPLAALVDSSGLCTSYGTEDSREVRRDTDAGPIGGDIQEDVLDDLAEKVGPDAGMSEAEAASHLLVQLCRPESKPAFRAMLHSAYDEVRQRGAIGLRAHGETVGDPARSRPVAFRVLVDGKPAVQLKVDWTLHLGDWQGESSSAESDGEGVVRVARDPFLDPRRRVTSVQLGAPDLAAPTDLWFAATLDVPANLDAVSTVSVRTGSLTVVIPRSLLAGAKGRRPTLQLLADTARYGVEAMPLPVSENLPVTSTRITFAHLQHGRYQAWLSRGSDLHWSSTAEVGDRPATLTINERSVDGELAEQLPPN